VAFFGEAEAPQFTFTSDGSVLDVDWVRAFFWEEPKSESSLRDRYFRVVDERDAV
jgi:hypothetical protein